MKKKIIIICLVVLIIGLMVLLGIKLFVKKPKTFIENVSDIYTSALEEHRTSGEVLYSNVYEEDKTIKNANEGLTYMVKFNDKGEIIYLVVSNGTERFQMGSIFEETPIKKEDITVEKIIKDETVIEPINTYNNYEIVDKGSNSSYVNRGYTIDSNNNITIALGQKNSGSYDMNISNIYVDKNAEYTIVVNVTEPTGDYQIQVLSYPFITIRFKEAVKITNLIIKDNNDNEFVNLSNTNTDNDVVEETKKENEKIRTIIIEKKEVKEKELEKLDKDEDGKITVKDIEVVEDIGKNTVIEKETGCVSGQYLKDGVCTPCPIDTYSTDGKTCVSCPIETCSKEGSKSVKDCKKCVKLSDPIKPPLVTE